MHTPVEYVISCNNGMWPLVRRSDGSRLSYLARDGGSALLIDILSELGPSAIVSTCSHAACNPRTPLSALHTFFAWIFVPRMESRGCTQTKLHERRQEIKRACHFYLEFSLHTF